MALNLTQLAAATRDYWMNRSPIDIAFTENVLLWKLFGKGISDNSYFCKANEIVDGGKMIRTFLEYGEANSGSYGNKTTISQTKQDIVNAARFRWAGYYASNTIDLDEQVQNSGAEAIVDLVMTKLRNIEKTLRNLMGSEVYSSATNSNCFLGLGDLFATVTATEYATVAEDDMTNWKANVITDSEAISFKVMQEIWRTPAIGQTRSKKPNLGITTEALKDGYERTLQTQQRFSDQKLVEAGFDNILHKGAPIVADDNQTSGYLDAVNLNYLHLKAHKDYNFTTPKWIAKQESGQPDVLVADSRFVGQLITDNRKAHCRHTGLTEPS